MTTNRVLLPHPLEPRVLLMHVHGEWRLPEWEDSTEHPWHVTDHVNRAVAARFGMETTVLRCVRARTEPGASRSVRVYQLENHSAAHDMVPASTWIGRAELPLLSIHDAETRELLAEWFSRAAGELPPRGAPWMSRGWYVEALAWVIARLTAIGATALGTPEQLRVSERAFVMRIATTQGRFFFKAVAHATAHEPPLVEWLAREFPANIAGVLAVDAARGWLLQRAVGDDAVPLAEVREEEEWYRAARRLAEIQVACSARTGELRELGCPRRGLETLARRIPRLCTDAGALLLGEPCGLGRADIERVAALAPAFLALCDELASYAIAESIEHGGLTADNVLSTVDGPVYLDWSASSLSHPFFSLAPLMSEAVTLLPATSRESQRRLRDAYLAAWTSFAAPQALVRAFDIARVLAPVHRAATAHAELIPAAGYGWEVQCIVPQCMRTALRLLADSDSPVSINP